MAQTATQVLESSERLVHLQSELACLQRIQKDNMKEIAERDICITSLRANIELLQQEGADSCAQVGRDVPFKNTPNPHLKSHFSKSISSNIYWKYENESTHSSVKYHIWLIH